MNLLYSNDTLGQYPDSWYAATTALLAAFAPLDADIRADVCIIGAGYTGLSAALAPVSYTHLTLPTSVTV